MNVIEVMKQALAFIESGTHSVQLAIDLRAAIQQMENAEPVAWLHHCSSNDDREFLCVDFDQSHSLSVYDGDTPLYAAPPVMKEAADALEAQAKEIEVLRAAKAEADDYASAVANACHAAEMQVLELMEDKERLDWLEQNPRHAQIMVDGVAADCVFYGISCSQLVKLREAIDAARMK